MISDEILTYLALPRIRKAVYFLTALVAAIFGAVSSLLSLNEIFPESALLLKTKSVWLSAYIEKTEEEREYFSTQEPITNYFAYKIPRFITRTVKRPFYRLDLHYPVEIYAEDTGEINITASKESIHPLAIKPQPDSIQIRFLSSKSLIFIPDTVIIPFRQSNPHLAYFESEEVAKPLDKKVLIQGRLISSDSIMKTDSNKKAPFKDLGGLEIRIIPKTIIFGMTEATLKGIQMLFGALGIPAILLLIVTFIVNKMVQKRNLKEDEHPRIIIPGEKGHHKTRRSS